MGGAFEAVQLTFGAPVLTVRVDQGQESVGELPELGRVQSFGLGQEDLDAAAA